MRATRTWGLRVPRGKQDSGGDDAGGAKHSFALTGAIPALRTDLQKHVTMCVHVDTPASKAPWAVYLLDCAGGKSYIGISPRPQERFEAHRAGKGGAFTRANRPQGLAALVWFESRSAAASIEPRLKCLRRQSKLAWFKHLAGTTAPAPATLDEGLASLSNL